MSSPEISYPEPHPYGNDFDSVEALQEIVDQRLADNLQVYGHAVCYIEGDRIPARVNFFGEITVGAHCEWI